MTNYKKLVDALRILQDKNSLSYYKRQVCKDAADSIEELQQKWFKSETDATNLTGKLAQAEADIDRLNLEIDKRIATEIELSNQVDALQAEVERFVRLNTDLLKCNDELREKQTYIDHYGAEWMTGAKDVPTAAYKHGYADGRAEVKAQLPKRGEWINSKERMRPDMCSVCGCVYEADRFMDKIVWKYCPNCGAKMEVQDGKSET